MTVAKTLTRFILSHKILLILMLVIAVAALVHFEQSSIERISPDLLAQAYDVEAQRARSSSLQSLTEEIAYTSTIPIRSSQSAIEWESRGPSNVGGRTRAVAFDVTNANVLLSGSVTGGLFRSEDLGASWQQVRGIDDVQGITALQQDVRQGQEDIWFLGTGEAYARGFERIGSGIYRSSDGGNTWQQLSSTDPGTSQNVDKFSFVWRLALDASNASQTEVYAATTGALYRSVDAGNSWTQVRSVPPSDNPFPAEDPSEVIVTDQGVVYHAVGRLAGPPTDQHGIWRSEDGVQWVNIQPSGWPSTYSRIVLAQDPAFGDRLYALALVEDAFTGEESHVLWRYTYVSGDGSGSGGTWEDFTNRVPSDFASQSGYDLTIGVKPDDSNTVYLGGVRLHRTTDGFTSPSNLIRLRNIHPDHHAIVFSPEDPDIVLVANDAGMVRATHNEAGQSTWTDINTDYQTSQFYTLALDQGTPGSRVILGGTQDNGTLWTSGTGDGEWEELLGGDGTDVAVSPGTGDAFLSYGGAEGVWRYEPAKVEGNKFAGIIIPPGDRIYLKNFALDPNDSERMYVSVVNFDASELSTSIMRQDQLSSISRSEIHSVESNWHELVNTRILPGIRTIAVSTKAPENRLYYAILSVNAVGQDRTQGRLFRIDDADDANSFPVEVTDPLFPFETITDIAINPENGDQILVAFPGHGVRSLFYSEDAGATWSDVGGNLEEMEDGSGSGPSVWAVSILPLSGGETLFLAGGTTGLFSTTELSGPFTEWQREASDTIGQSWVEAIASRSSDGFVAVGTYGNGVFSASIDAASVDSDPDPQLPVYAGLEAPYPNPVAQRITIPVRVSNGGLVTIQVHDALGRVVETIHNGYLASGEYPLVWDAEKTSAGVYFVRMVSEGFVDVKTISVLH